MKTVIFIGEFRMWFMLSLTNCWWGARDDPDPSIPFKHFVVGLWGKRNIFIFILYDLIISSSDIFNISRSSFILSRSIFFTFCLTTHTRLCQTTYYFFTTFPFCVRLQTDLIKLSNERRKKKEFYIKWLLFFTLFMIVHESKINIRQRQESKKSRKDFSVKIYARMRHTTNADLSC